MEPVPPGRGLQPPLPPVLRPVQPPVPVGQPLPLRGILLRRRPGGQGHHGGQRQRRTVPQPGPRAVDGGFGGGAEAGRRAGHHRGLSGAGGPGVSGAEYDGLQLPAHRRAGPGPGPGLLFRRSGLAALGLGGIGPPGAGGHPHSEGGRPAPAGGADAGAYHPEPGLYPPGDGGGGLRRSAHRGGELPLAAAGHGAVLAAAAVHLPVFPPEDIPARPGADGGGGPHPPGGAGLPDRHGDGQPGVPIPHRLLQPDVRPAAPAVRPALSGGTGPAGRPDQGSAGPHQPPFSQQHPGDYQLAGQDERGRKGVQDDRGPVHRAGRRPGPEGQPPGTSGRGDDLCKRLWATTTRPWSASTSATPT